MCVCVVVVVVVVYVVVVVVVIVIVYCLYSTLSTSLPLRVDPNTFDNSHTKAFLLLQAHYCRIDLPIVDYITDTKSVLDQALRILQVRHVHVSPWLLYVSRWSLYVSPWLLHVSPWLLYILPWLLYV